MTRFHFNDHPAGSGDQNSSTPWLEVVAAFFILMTFAAIGIGVLISYG